MLLYPHFSRKQFFQIEIFGNNSRFFFIYLGTSWIEAIEAMESMGLSTGWWKDVYQIFGTSWMLCGFVALVNENIWEIVAPWMGPLLKRLIWSLLKRRVCAKFQLLQSPRSCFLLTTTTFFLLIFDGNIFFFACLREIYKILLRFEQDLGLNYL